MKEEEDSKRFFKTVIGTERCHFLSKYGRLRDGIVIRMILYSEDSNTQQRGLSSYRHGFEKAGQARAG